MAAAIMALAGPLPYPVAWKIAEGTCQRSRPDGHAVPPQAPRALLRLPAAPAPGRAVRRRTGQGRGYPAGILAGAAGRAEHRRLCAGRRIRPARRGLTVVYATDTRPALRAGSRPGRGPAVHGLDLRRRHRPAQGETLRPRYLSGDRCAGRRSQGPPPVADPLQRRRHRPCPGLAAARAQYPAAAAGYDGLQLELEFDEG